ncbi:MAG: hypothetical protein ACLQLC_07640 [Candidatus Sulfotelmatobacter sp.]
MTRLRLLPPFILLTLAVLLLTGFGHDLPFWSQWGANPQHSGMVGVLGQPLNTKIADIIYDPFVNQEKTENQPLYGEAVLTAHYQSTLIDGDSFYMEQKSGTYIGCNPLIGWIYGEECGPNAWYWMTWNVVRYDWVNGQAVQSWTFSTDWKPEPSSTNFLHGFVGLEGWEPVFHPALGDGYLYVPGAGGTIWKVDEATGQSITHINPFSKISIDPSNTYVSGPLTAATNGDIYYNVLQLSSGGNPWNERDIAGAWLVRVRPDDTSSTVTYATLVPDAPPANSTTCPGIFNVYADNGGTLPWPPPGIKAPPTVLCGSQRPGVNIAPAIGPDGTVYTASFAHFDGAAAYLIAVHPDLSPKWASSLQYRLTDGCGVLLPIAPPNVTTLPGSCRYGTKLGVDPTTNAYGSGTITDLSSASPTVAPDGSVLFGVIDNYNYGRGHTMHFDAQGNYLNAYGFGWDSTPAIYQHDDTYSIVLKDNHYNAGAYCNWAGHPVCRTAPEGPYYMTQLDANMNVEWSFQNTTIDSDHPDGYEWCVNAPAIDNSGIVYATSEDGHIYSIPQGHKGVFKTPRQNIFLLEALGAAYTPLAIGEDGKEYSQNDGHLFVVGR